METRKLYYEDCHLYNFDAAVISCEPAAKSWRITLDATAFYPEGGGQACDIGTLGSVRVLDVQEEGEEVAHYCDGPLEAGATVHGSLDVSRRFDLMQQHAGEHILSGIIHQKYGHHNVGFHVGNETLEVDFDGPIPAEDLPWLETKANEAVWANVPIRCWIPSQEVLPQVTYRSKRALPWPVRIVEIPGADSCACCGIHVGATGEIGLIKILSCIKFHQGVRLQMVCGGRALRYMQAIYEQNRQVSQLFSAKPLETGAAAKRMNDALAAEKFRAVNLERQIFQSIAQAYAGQHNILHITKDLTGGALRELSDTVAAKITGIAAVLSGSDDAGYSLCLVSHTEDVRPLGKAAAAALSGRGGGKKEAFQGSIKATRAQIEAFFTQNFQ